MTARREYSTAELYEAMNEKWPKHGPKKMTVARYCAELENRGFLVRNTGMRVTTWRFKGVIER